MGKLKYIDTKIDALEHKIETKIDALDKKFEAKIDALDKKFEAKFEKVEERLNSLEIKQTKLTEKVEGMNDRLQSVKKKKKNQVWALIVLLAGAIATAGFRTFFIGNP